jgi:Fur family transcriptional regulator, peroxide stress response regulator
MKVESSEINRRVEHFKTKAREAGVKLTHQRLEIFREIASRPDHPDAESIYDSLRHRMPSVTLDTVYRTLWILYDLNLIATYGQLRETVHFDPNPEPHNHYICVRCGIIRDLTTPEFDEFQLPTSTSAYGSVLAFRVELSGLCEGCARGSRNHLAN